MKPRIVLAYGGPEASGAIASLAREHDADVVTLTLDLGDQAPLDGIRDLSLGSGAIRAHVLDVREEFARDIILAAARAGTFARAASVAALAVPLLAKKLVDVARIEKASAVAYVAGTEGEALEAAVRRYDSAIRVVVTHAPAGAGREPRVQRRAVTTPSGPAQVEISFGDGIPTAINRIPMRIPELLESLTTIAVEHGVGTPGHLYTPAATVLHAAYAALGSSRAGTVRLKLADGRCDVEESASAHV